jgi:hypothetical protein
VNFVDGKIAFLSRSARHQMFPIGEPQKQVVDGEVILTNGPAIMFRNHRFQTTDQPIALGMMRADTFDTKIGFNLDISCLPDELREFYPKCDRETRRKIGIALANGESVEKAFNLIPAEATVEQPPDEGFSRAPLEVICPVPHCGVKATGKFAGAAIQNHRFEKHPDWHGEE